MTMIPASGCTGLAKDGPSYATDSTSHHPFGQHVVGNPSLQNQDHAAVLFYCGSRGCHDTRVVALGSLEELLTGTST